LNAVELEYAQTITGTVPFNILKLSSDVSQEGKQNNSFLIKKLKKSSG
jgi:hypothetical protein